MAISAHFIQTENVTFTADGPSPLKSSLLTSPPSSSPDRDQVPDSSRSTQDQDTLETTTRNIRSRLRSRNKSVASADPGASVPPSSGQPGGQPVGQPGEQPGGQPGRQPGEQHGGQHGVAAVTQHSASVLKPVNWDHCKFGCGRVSFAT